MGNVSTTHYSNLLGAILANVINLLVIFICLARLAQRPQIEHWLGVVFILSIAPLGYLLLGAFSLRRPPIYSIWIGLMIVFLIVKFVLDCLLEFEFRKVRWMVIAYVMLFFGATGGMIGVASQAGKGWTTVTSISFLVTAILAFVQRSITGM